ncbi:MAG: ferrochelatase [Candidatus Omnitrophota bacterium]|jgi:ferrochelatase
MSALIDHILLLGYGSASRPEEVSPFLSRIAAERHIPAERMTEVAKHYEAIGGVSPYGAEVLGFARALEARLAERGTPVPVFTGMKYSEPLIEETVQEIRRADHRTGLGVVLAPHRSHASFESYVHRLEDVLKLMGASEIRYRFVSPWHAHPLFIRANADVLTKTAQSLSGHGWQDLPVIFSVHSVPLAMPGASRYEQDARESAEKIAAECGLSDWQMMYQSRSSGSGQTWLGPDPSAVLMRLAAEGRKSAIVVPLGFLCENAEILYDLDIEMKSHAAAQGIKIVRCGTVMLNPHFLELFCELCTPS